MARNTKVNIIPALAKKRLVAFVQFDPEGGILPHVRVHLKALREVATRLVFVSNSPLSTDALTFAHSLCDDVLQRENTGYDFAGWRDALARQDMTQYDSVILTNSSIVGPLFPLLPILDEMDAKDAAFWGMVHSLQCGSHLPSYFLSFSARVTTSQTWTEFWSGVEMLTDKWEVIRRYEIGLTRHFEQAGFRYASYIPSPRFPKSIKIVDVERLGGWIRLPYDVNRVGRTIRQHYELIEEGMPYLKASLLWGKDRARLTPIDRIKALDGVKYPWSEIGF